MKWLILFLSTSALAQDFCIDLPEEFKDIEALHSHMVWNGASDKQVDSAPCVTKTPPRKESIKAVIDAAKKTKTNETVNGVDFKDEDPDLIKHFKELTTATGVLGGNPVPEEQVDIQNKFSINPECTKVECAVKRIWGEDLGSKILYIKLKHGYNTSELAFKFSDRFTVSEINDITMGLDDLPNALMPLANPNQRLTHFTRGSGLKMNEGKQVEANAVVMLFDLWDQKSNRGRQYTMFHELSHNIGSRIGDIDQSPEWIALSGWVKKGDAWSSAPGTCFISKYGETNPAEDWAETVSSYRYSGSNLKATCPEKYKFLKEKVFKGYEYTDSYSCSELPQENLEKAHLALSYGLQNSLPPKLVTAPDIAKGCGQKFTSYPPSPSEISDCSLELLIKGNPVQIEKLLKESLAQAGIEDTDRNRNILLATLNEDLESKKLIGKKIKGISEGVASIYNDAVKASLPIGMGSPSPDDTAWWKSSKKCGAAFLSTSLENLKLCLAKNIAADDADWQYFDKGKFPKFNMPGIFSSDAEPAILEKRNEKLAVHLTKQEEFKTISAKKIAKFKDDLKWQYMGSTNEFSSLSKNLSPKEFCTKTYGSASSFLTSYGYAKGDPIPTFQTWCEKQQETKPERFIIPEAEWKKLTDPLVSK